LSYQLQFLTPKVHSRKTAVPSDALLLPFRVALSEILGASVIHLAGLDLAQDLAAIAATSDQLSWSRRRRPFMVCHRGVTIRSGAFCIDR